MKTYMTIALGACIAAATGCGAAAAEGGLLGYSGGFLTDPFQSVLVQQVLDAAKAANLKTMPATNANGNAGKQISDMQNLIASGAEGIIVNRRTARPSSLR